MDLQDFRIEILAIQQGRGFFQRVLNFAHIALRNFYAVINDTQIALFFFRNGRAFPPSLFLTQ